VRNTSGSVCVGDRGIRVRRILLVAFAFAIGLSVGGLGTWTYINHQQRLETDRAERLHAEVSAAFARADAQVRPVYAALNSVPMHFTNTVYFVNTVTPQQEAAPLIQDLTDARTAIGSSRSTLSGLSGSPAVSVYLRGLALLDTSCQRYIAFTQKATVRGQHYYDSSWDVSERYGGRSGYGVSQDQLRESLLSDPDRSVAALAMQVGEETLAQARDLAR
jgi:hypothetical protein